jgi:hypothetical protein
MDVQIPPRQTMRIGRSKVEKHEYTLKADLKPMEDGIPEVTDFHSEDRSLTDTFCLRLSKNEPIHCI